MAPVMDRATYSAAGSGGTEEYLRLPFFFFFAGGGPGAGCGDGGSEASRKPVRTNFSEQVARFSLNIPLFLWRI